MKFQSNLKNLVNFFIFWKNLVKCLVTYMTKCMVDAILKTISIKQNIVNFKTPIVLFMSKILYCHQYSCDFTYFIGKIRRDVLYSWLTFYRELFLHSWLTFRENGPYTKLAFNNIWCLFIPI